jgi:hypothetical protein
MRWPLCLLIWLKVTFSVSEVAGTSATGHVTSDSFRKPFQFARGAVANNSVHPDGDSIGQPALGSPQPAGISIQDKRPQPRPERKRTAATASSADNPDNGSYRAIRSASTLAWGSVRSFPAMLITFVMNHIRHQLGHQLGSEWN